MTTTPGAMALSAETKQLLDAANEAARREGSQWFYFVTLMVYLAVAVGGVTHRRLFLAEPVTLPIFNVALPLTGFFIVAPTIFVVLHFYTLAQLRVMARKVEAALAEALRVGEPIDAVIQRLDSFAVAQMLAGRRLGQRPVAPVAMAWITLIIAPVMLLLFFQIRFLPYHDPAVTWVHRILLTVDLGLLWWLWPRTGGSRRASVSRAVAALATMIVFCFSLALATVPGEWADRLAYAVPGQAPAYSLRGLRDPLLVLWDRISARVAPPGSPDQSDRGAADEEIIGEPWAVALRRALFDGRIHPYLPRATSLFSRVLILPDERFVPARDSDFADLQSTVVLRGRDLRGALLFRADLRKADLTGAQLYLAWLDEAQLQGARLDGAWLGAAWLRKAALQGASLVEAQLQGASLDGAQLHGALLDRAQLQGASLKAAQLHGASLVGTQLQGAMLNEAQLNGAAMDGTNLQAAALFAAELQGASLSQANLRGALLGKARLWRSLAYRADLTLADMRHLDFSPLNVSNDVIGTVTAGIPPGRLRDGAIDRLNPLSQPLSKLDQVTLRRFWPDPIPQEPPDSARVARLLGDVACSRKADPSDDPTIPHTAEAIANQIESRDLGSHGAELAKRLLNTNDCPGARGLSDRTRAALERIK